MTKLMLMLFPVALLTSCCTPAVVMEAKSKGVFTIEAKSVHRIYEVSFINPDDHSPFWTILENSNAGPSGYPKDIVLDFSYGKVPSGYEEQHATPTPLPKDKAVIVQVGCVAGFWHATSKTWQFYYLNGNISDTAYFPQPSPNPNKASQRYGVGPY